MNTDVYLSYLKKKERERDKRPPVLTEQTETNDKKLNLSENEFVSGKL